MGVGTRTANSEFVLTARWTGVTLKFARNIRTLSLFRLGRVCGRLRVLACPHVRVRVLERRFRHDAANLTRQ